MCRSGVQTGMGATLVAPSPTPKARFRARTAYSEAAVGATPAFTAAQRTATTATSGHTVATALGSGLSWPQLSPERERSGGAAHGWRGGAMDERSLPAETQDFRLYDAVR